MDIIILFSLFVGGYMTRVVSEIISKQGRFSEA